MGEQMVVGQRLLIMVGTKSALGRGFFGKTVGEVRTILLNEAPAFGLTEADPASILTMDADDAAWRQLPGNNEDGLVIYQQDDGKTLILQGIRKSVPDTYVIRPADAVLMFVDP